MKMWNEFLGDYVKKDDFDINKIFEKYDFIDNETDDSETKKSSIEPETEPPRLVDTTSLYEAFYATIYNQINAGQPEPPALTSEERMSRKNFSMKDIESLFFALSLSIENPNDRQAFDVIFVNWKNDQLAKIK